MKRYAIPSVLVAFVLLVAPILRADVATAEKSSFKLEGFIGGMITKMAGGGGENASKMFLKGDRMATFGETTGSIIDLKEQKIYSIDMKKKEYMVLTFAEMRAQMEEAKKSLEEQKKNMSQSDKDSMQQATKNIDFDIKTTETGQKKQIAGYDTHEVIVTVTMHEKGKPVEESGGLVLTSNVFLGPKVPAMDEFYQFSVRMMKAIFGEGFTGIDMRASAMAASIIPGFGEAMSRSASELQKLSGTALSTTTVVEGVKSAEQMKNAGSSQQQPTGGGISGMLAKKMMGNKGGTQQRTKALTTTRDVLSIGTSVSASDLEIPAGFKEKKK
jgi:hypothetical protein